MMKTKCEHGIRDLETNLPYCRRCDAAAKAKPGSAAWRVIALESALRDLLLSADCSWYEQSGGHDWRNAVDVARQLLYPPPAPAQPGEENQT